MTFDDWLFAHAVDLNDTPRTKADLCKLVWDSAVAEEQEAAVVRRQEDGFWLILHNEKGDAAINLGYEQRGPIVRAVLAASAIRARQP